MERVMSAAKRDEGPGLEGRVRRRVEEILHARFGRVEEMLVATGVLDSLKTIELALDLEQEFGVPLDKLTTQDTTTLTSLVRRLVALGATC